MNLVLFLLCSGFVHFAAAANRFRRFYIINRDYVIWKDSLEKCTNRGMSFATVYNEDETNSLQEFVGTNEQDIVWLGLRRIRENVTTWSNGDPYTFNLTNVTVKREEQRCGAVEDNEYTDFGCNASLHFMCYEGNNYHLIDNMTKDWCQAQQYCRRHFKDLVSINDETQKKQVVEEGRTKTFWIGLLHDEWEWQDGSCSTYRTWDNLESGNCAALSLQTPPSLFETDCSIGAKTLCSKGKVRIVVVRENLTWEKALDYCLAHHSGLLWIEDKDDQNDVKQILTNLTVDGTFWIGLKQSRVFGFWIWSDRMAAYSNWVNGKTPEKPFYENCGVINATSSEWQDDNCSNLHQFLCEEIYLNN